MILITGLSRGKNGTFGVKNKSKEPLMESVCNLQQLNWKQDDRYAPGYFPPSFG